ncbi:MAG: EVE domain-containing protein [Candidatus Brocadiales bacterium]
MSYHIFVTKRENFEFNIQSGAYGGAELKGSKKSPQINADIIASFTGIKKGDFVFFYVTGKGVYGLWKVNKDPFYDDTPIFKDVTQLYPIRVCMEPAIRRFSKPIALSDILDLKDRGRIWTFDLGAIGRKNHNPITTEEGKELIRLLLRNNPIFSSISPLAKPYVPKGERSLPLKLECDKKGRLLYEGYLNAWFMNQFKQNRLKEVIGEYRDCVNFVPTSFNKVMDIFLTHVTTIDSVDILHKFTCIELKTGTVNEDDLNQIIRYEDWLIRKLANGDTFYQKLYEEAVKNNDERMIKFCKGIFDVYDKCDINTHIERPNHE